MLLIRADVEEDKDVDGVLDDGMLVRGDFLLSSLLTLERDGGRGEGEDREVRGEGAER